MANGLTDLTARNQEAAKAFTTGTPRRNTEQIARRRQALRQRTAPKSRSTPEPVAQPTQARAGALSRAIGGQFARPRETQRPVAKSVSVQQPVATPQVIERPVAMQMKTLAAPAMVQQVPIEVMNTADALVAGSTPRNVATSRELPRMSARQMNLPRLTTAGNR